MTAYNFKTKWANGTPTNFRQLILDGTKKHTIRPQRKYLTRAGYMLQLYQGMRTKNCELVMTIACLKVRHIVINPYIFEVILDERLHPDQVVALAHNDGFNDTTKFFEFFKIYDPYTLMNKLELIQWAETPY